MALLPVTASISYFAVSVAAGYRHSCAAFESGDYACWGNNDAGQLGTGAFGEIATVPVLDSVSDRFEGITAGKAHTCGWGAGRLCCWGDGSHGQLGASSLSPASSPVDLGFSNVVMADAGEAHTCAVKTDTNVTCWGQNDRGQVSPPASLDRLIPYPVPGTGFVDVSAGQKHSCAARADGSVQCWGSNNQGQLGDGTTTSRTTPVTNVTRISNIIDVECGAQHTCALDGTGTVYCWGDNSQRQFGNDLAGSFPTPTVIPIP